MNRSARVRCLHTNYNFSLPCVLSSISISGSRREKKKIAREKDAIAHHLFIPTEHRVEGPLKRTRTESNWKQQYNCLEHELQRVWNISCSQRHILQPFVTHSDLSGDKRNDVVAGKKSDSVSSICQRFESLCAKSPHSSVQTKKNDIRIVECLRRIHRTMMITMIHHPRVECKESREKKTHTHAMSYE